MVATIVNTPEQTAAFRIAVRWHTTAFRSDRQRLPAARIAAKIRHHQAL